jgi:hypothetical protein
MLFCVAGFAGGLRPNVRKNRVVCWNPCGIAYRSFRFYLQNLRIIAAQQGRKLKKIRQLVAQAIKDTGSKIEPAALIAFISVESGGRGFCPSTGKIMIQFEPHWFKRKAPYAPSGKWSLNGIERQSKEWEAFNSAFALNPDAAMKATSIGLPQIMGFHWERLGYANVGAMWDDFKVGELNQIKALIKFIETDARLLKAILEKDWHMVAMAYNGVGYAAQAHRLGIKPYNEQMKIAHAAELARAQELN